MSDTPKSYESDTPETQEAVERWRQGKINIFDEMARLERERNRFCDALRAIARMDTSRANARSLLSVAVAKHAVEESFNGVSSPVKHNATNALILDYEIRSSRFAGFMFGKFLQGIAARYFAWKVSSKMGRYIANKQSSAQ